MRQAFGLQFTSTTVSQGVALGWYELTPLASAEKCPNSTGRQECLPYRPSPAVTMFEYRQAGELAVINGYD
jgi:hypothetical protein